MRLTKLFVILLFLMPFVMAQNVLFEFEQSTTPMVRNTFFTNATAFVDKSSNGYGDLTLINTGTLVLSQGNYEVDGSQRLTIDNSDLKKEYGLTNFTISLWFKFNNSDFVVSENLFSTRNTTGSNEGIRCFVNSVVHDLRCNLDNGTGSDTILTSPVLVNDSDWHNLVITRAIGGQVIMYLDGVQDDASTLTTGDYRGGNIISLGSQISPSTPMNGSFDEFRIYNRSLSVGEVAQLYNNVTSINGLLYHLDFTTEFDISNSYPSVGDFYLYNYPHWIALNDVATVEVTNVNDDTTNFAQVILGNGTPVNMSYNSNTNRFSFMVSSALEEDVSFNVTIYSDDVLDNNTVGLGTGIHTLRFRTPFTVTLDFYKNANFTDTELKPYDNEFQYALLLWDNSSESDYSYTLDLSNYDSVNFLNKLGRLFPYYKDVGIEGETGLPVTDEIYLWDRLQSGSADITVYENGTYRLYVFDTQYVGTALSYYEFAKPIPNKQSQFKSKVVEQLPVTNETAQGFDVFISAWEVYRWNLVKNIGKVLLLFLAWAFLVIMVSYIPTIFIDNPDIKAKAFGAVIGTLVIATSPIFIVLAKMVWG